MSIHSGTLSAIEIGKIYNVGYAYAVNIVNRLEEIGYIKKDNTFGYLMIQTEQAIDAYIKEHLEEFRPDYYDVLELKNNGDPSLKAKAKDVWRIAPKFICRVFISPFSIGFTLLTVYSGIKANAPISEIILLILAFSIPFCAFCNIGYGIYMSKRKNIKFKDFMIRPWFHTRIMTILEIRKIIKGFKFCDYYETLRRLKIYLRSKKELAEHYADIANNAENENEFYQSINSCLEVLEWMSQFEKYGVYEIGKQPSKDIKKIKDGMTIAIERFNNRMKSSGNIALDFDSMEGHDFEYFCADLLRKNGYENVEVTQGSGDQGIDIVAIRDGAKYGIQCKCYSSDIGNKAIQEAFSGAKFYDCHVPVVLTNRHFTKSAKELSQRTNVLLWDRDYLLDLIENAQLQ